MALEHDSQVLTGILPTHMLDVELHLTARFVWIRDLRKSGYAGRHALKDKIHVDLLLKTNEDTWRSGRGRTVFI